MQVKIGSCATCPFLPIHTLADFVVLVFSSGFVDTSVACVLEMAGGLTASIKVLFQYGQIGWY